MLDFRQQISRYFCLGCSSCVFTLTPEFPDSSISPESSDGFASVWTILPKEKAALLPGGLFALNQL